MKRHLSIMTSIIFAFAGGPGLRAAAAAQEAVSEEPDAIAKQMFREQRYLEAATAFEELWTAKQIPKGLFNAAMAREMMGHELHAFVLLREYLDIPELSASERAKAEDRIRVLQERAPKLRVIVSPADIPVAGLDLHVRRGALDPSRVEVHLDGSALAMLAAPGEPGAYDLPAEPGPWSLELAARGYAPGRASVTVAREQVSQTSLTLEPLTDGIEPEPSSPQVPDSPPRDGASGRSLALGLGVAAGVMVVAGAVTLGVSGSRWGRNREALLDATGTYRADPTHDELPWEAASDRLASNWLSTNGGAGMLGAGLGLGLGSVTSVAPRRKSVWAAEVAIGAALGLGAFVAYTYTVDGFNRRHEKIRYGADSTKSWDDQSKRAASDSLNRSRTEGLVSSLLVGVGAGLLVSGIVGLIHGRRPSPGLARTSISPYSGRHGSGVVLKLQF